MRFDQTQQMTAGYLIPPAARDADNTPASFDIGTADACSIFIEVGVGGITFTTTNKVEFKLTHSDAASAGFEPVTLEDVVGVEAVGAGGIVRALIAAHATPSVAAIGYVGGKRYLRMLADFSGTHNTPTPMAVLGVRSRLLSVAP